MAAIVLKIGTNVLTDHTGAVSEAVIDCYAHQATKLIGAGYAPIFVTSGAVRMGRTLNLGLEDKKSLAAVGQTRLMEAYGKALAKEGLVVAQFVLSRTDLGRRELFEAFRSNLAALIASGVIPLINENDALTNGEPESFGENDALAAIVAVASEASHLIYLTDQSGLYTADPRTNDDAKHLVCDTSDVTKEFFAYCSKATSSGGMGGMLTKLKGAQLAIAGGVETYIANGKMCVEIADLMSCHIPATRFFPKRSPKEVSAHDRWMIASRASTGMLQIDDGAVTAVKASKTLLAVGVRKVIGTFHAGEIVEIVDRDGHGIGCGAVLIDALSLTHRMKEGDIKDLDVIHRDYLITY